jgi:hypothetical protein
MTSTESILVIFMGYIIEGMNQDCQAETPIASRFLEFELNFFCSCCKRK